MFVQQELRHVLISLLALGIIFGFNDGAEVFEPTSWFLHLILVLVLCAAFFLIRLYVQKRIGDFYDALVEYRLWFTRRYGFAKRAMFRKPLPIGMLIALVVMIASSGLLYFTALGHLYITPKLSRIGRKFSEVSEYEEALIAFGGVATHMVFIILFSWLGKILMWDVTLLVLINAVMLFFLMIPLPPLDGGLLFFGSRNLYIFTAAFCLATYALIFLPIGWSLLVGVIVSAGILGVYHYKWEL